MAWAWRYERGNGQKGSSEGSEPFPSQSDAESWLGQSWRDLVADGVVTAVLVEDERVEYKMSLLPAGE
jgi:ribosome modulation factor